MMKSKLNSLHSKGLPGFSYVLTKFIENVTVHITLI